MAPAMDAGPPAGTGRVVARVADKVGHVLVDRVTYAVRDPPRLPGERVLPSWA